jgi:ectoine hydroxylase-related dioxygenase (phytanoyl-CoA dioxygenase family)
MSNSTIPPRVDEPFPLKPDQIRRFRQDGFIKLRGVFDAETLAYYGEEITRITLANNKLKDVPMEQRGTYGRAFIQVTNLWCRSDRAREFSFGKRLARLATELMGVSGVRMWHDQALYKEAGGGFTPWHVDQQYWPMASDKSVTAWVPLQATPLEMGPMAFGRGTHMLDIARGLEISDESEGAIAVEIERRRIEQVWEPFELGEVSFHTGWTLHRAGPNTTGTPRKVHTVIYMDEQMRLAEPANANQKVDWEAWTPGTRVGDVMADPLNPVLYRAG